jgi:hypothetical protein
MRRAAYALQQAKEDHLGKAVGQAAQRRGYGKAGDRDQKDPFDAEGASQPAGQRDSVIPSLPMI